MTNKTPILLSRNRFPIGATIVFLEGRKKKFFFENKTKVIHASVTPSRRRISILEIICSSSVLKTESQGRLSSIRGKETGTGRPQKGTRLQSVMKRKGAGRSGHNSVGPGISAVKRVPTSSGPTRAPRIPRTEEMKAHTKVISIPNIFCKLHHMGLTFAEDIFRISVSIPKEN